MSKIEKLMNKLDKDDKTFIVLYVSLISIIGGICIMLMV